MKESFEYVLPSNTSSTLYPNNTASHFTIVPDNPLQLQGAWEVGVKSIFYNSNIGDKTEKASVQLDYEKQNTTYANDIYPVKYKVASGNKWNYNWRKVLSFNMKQPTSQSPLSEMAAFDKYIANQLNQWNKVVVEDDRHAFEFRSDMPYIFYNTAFSGLSIRFQAGMAIFLGYRYRTFLNIDRLNTWFQLVRDADLLSHDFEIMVFDRNVVKRHKQVILKHKGEPMLSRSKFIKRWRSRVSPHVNSIVNFQRHKLIIHMHDHNAALVFNKCMLDTIRSEETLFGTGSFWSNHPYYPMKGGMKPEEDDWIIDIYKD